MLQNIQRFSSSEPEPFELDVNLEGNELSVKTVKGKVFGPQPYLAVKTKSGRYIHDEFDFGAKRCQRFIKRANLKAECIVDDLATWDDFIQQIKEELGIQITIRRND